MSEMRHANSFRELVVYQHAREVSRAVFQLSKSFPKEEMYSLTDQIRRCSLSVGAQIAEAWGKRRYERHFASKLTDADAEQLETQHWVDTALDYGYIAPNQAEGLNQKLSSVGRMLCSMIAKSEQFCGPVPETGHR
jgi:four helix bundle protein